MTTTETIGVGSVAPDFTLKSGSGDEVTLSEVLGNKKAVLVFYVFDFSGA